MANLSSIKRQKMLDFLNIIKKDHTDDDSIRAISEIENHLLDKKFGLVWEDHQERVDCMLEENIPIFTEDIDKKISCSKVSAYNFIIEGDNLQSLYLLEKTHKGAVDIIYIDPPYNTGNKDFKYDDNYVTKEDTFRHSKWLSFMEKRMRIAYNLLSERGILFVSIDDNEQAVIKMLLDEIFTEGNFIINLPRITKKSGKTTGSFSKNHDYVLVYTKGDQSIFVNEEHFDSDYKYEDEFVAERGKYKLNQTLDYDSLSYSSSLDYPLEIDGVVYYPGGDKEAWEARMAGNHRRADWAWRWNKKLFDFGYKNGFVVIKNNNDGTSRIYTKTYLNAKINKVKGEYCVEYINRDKPMSSIELVENIYSNDNAKKEFDSFGIDEDFDYPKPSELIKRLIKSYYDKDALVLDFFAGSGTTGQAVLELNVQDGGHRRFILCTNNENEICEKITYKRCHDTILSHSFKYEDKTAIMAHKIKISDLTSDSSVNDELKKAKVENKDKYKRFKTEVRDDCIFLYGIKSSKVYNGIPANLKYFKCDWTPRKPEDYYLSNALCLHIKEMIELKTGMEIDNVSNVLILNRQDFHAYILNNTHFYEIKNIWLNQNIVFNLEEVEWLTHFNSENIQYIPNEFFGGELKAVAE